MTGVQGKVGIKTWQTASVHVTVKFNWHLKKKENKDANNKLSLNFTGD